MHKHSTLDLHCAPLYRFPTPLPASSASLELWETSEGDAGPFTQEFRLVDDRGRTLCTRTFYQSIDIAQKVG